MYIKKNNGHAYVARLKILNKELWITKMVATSICSVSPLPNIVKVLNFHHSPSNQVINKFQNKCSNDHTQSTRIKWNWVVKSSSSSNNNITKVAATSVIQLELESASNVVKKFYGGINGRDLSSVEALIADHCVYEDLIFPHPFVGRKVFSCYIYYYPLLFCFCGS